MKKGICSEYNWCAIPLHELFFSLMCFLLSFNDFEMSVLNHLMIAPSQLYQVSYSFIKVFQYLCEYKGSKPTIILLFHIFKTQNNMDNHACGLGLISLRKTTRFFETYSHSVKNFKDHYFLFSPINKENHGKI